MTFLEEVADLRQRIAKAQSQRDTWRASGKQENYLEAYSLVEALEVQLDGLRRQGLLAFGKHDDPPGARDYRFSRYRNDLLTDALNYERLPHSMLPGRQTP